MRLFVWEDVLEDYTSGIMFALAETVEEARETICPGWGEGERALAEGAREDDRPGGYYFGQVHTELRAEPDVYERHPIGFTIWGGG